MADVVICECFLRDGLQHESIIVETATKVGLLEAFAAAGFTRIEATSYSNPAVVPQCADASDVLRRLSRTDGVFYKATCANVTAVKRALADLESGHGASEISFLSSASEAHSTRNLKRTRAEQWENVRTMKALAGDRFRIIGTISVAFGCPFEGAVEARVVLEDIARFLQLGVRYVALGDTTGMATPATVKRMVSDIVRNFPEAIPIVHFHDSRGTGLVNCLAAYEAGVRYFDAAIGGVGGHPAKLKYGGGHTGNVCTEDLVGLLQSMGIDTGIDLDQLLRIAERCEAVLGRTLGGHVTRTGWNPIPPQTGGRRLMARETGSTS